MRQPLSARHRTAVLLLVASSLVSACAPSAPPRGAGVEPVAVPRERAGESRLPAWMIESPELRRFDEPRLEACTTSLHLEMADDQHLLDYVWKVGPTEAPFLSERLDAEAERLHLDVVKHPHYLELEVPTARVTVEAGELEITTWIDPKASGRERARILEGASFADLLPLLGGPPALASVSVTRDDRGRRAWTLTTRRPPTRPLETWIHAHHLASGGHDDATGCEVWNGVSSEASIHLCVAPDGVSVTETLAGFHYCR